MRINICFYSTDVGAGCSVECCNGNGDGGGSCGGGGGGDVGDDGDGDGCVASVGDDRSWSRRYGWTVAYAPLPFVPPEAPDESCTHLYIMRRRRKS